jgi:arylsulfatase A-like enzyme
MHTKKNLAAVLMLSASLFASGQNRPNVVFIMADDMNDWVGPFKGNPQISTPNMDKLCASNAMVFKNAHVTGTVCGPSRSSMLSGFRPETTGLYSNVQNMINSEIVQQNATLPEYFSKHGYITISKGKIFHKHQTAMGRDHGHWAFDIWEDNKGAYPIDRDKLYSRLQGIYDGKKIEGALHEGGSQGNDPTWAPTTVGKEETSDYMTAKWFAGLLQDDYEKPFFMAVGFAKPHVPWYVPQEYFDRYGLDTLKIPSFTMDDLDDIKTPDGINKFSPSGDFLWAMQDEERFKLAVRAYMANISYVDDCIGVVLDAIEKSKYKDNTIIMVMGDHGYHLGEKLRFNKATLWSESTRTPLIIRTPEMKKSSECNRVVNFIDIFPTLIELCSLPEKNALDGRSFAPLLKNPDKNWPYPSVSVSHAGLSHTVNDEVWRYTRYEDGTEELYNLINDPREYSNLINSQDKKALKAKTKLEKWIPVHCAQPVQSNFISNRAADAIPSPDLTIKESRDLSKLK